MTTAIEKSASEFQTDRYFTNVRRALEKHGLNPVVTYRCFMRTDVLAVYRFVEEYLARSLGAAGVQFDLRELHREGDLVRAKSPLFELTGRFQDLVEHETMILWYTGWPSLSCYNARRIRDAAVGVKLVDMAARHCPGPDAVRMASYAAHVAGFDACSTDLGASTWGGEGVGTMPHAWIGAFPSTVAAAKAFADAFPDRGVTILVDYFGTELDDAVACYRELGDRLEAVRIDTHGGRYCQGVVNTEAEGDYAAIHRLNDVFGVHYAGRFSQYAYGKGVTVEAAYVLRAALDKAGANGVKIVVSSGFTPEKVEAFVSLGAPVDVIGTGSFLPTDIRDTYATMDIVSYDGKPKIKVGREWLLPFQRRSDGA